MRSLSDYCRSASDLTLSAAFASSQDEDEEYFTQSFNSSPTWQPHAFHSYLRFFLNVQMKSEWPQRSAAKPRSYITAPCQSSLRLTYCLFGWRAT